MVIRNHVLAYYYNMSWFKSKSLESCVPFFMQGAAACKVLLQ